jgi:hypothetical protein
MEESPYLFSRKAVARRLKSLVDAIGKGVPTRAPKREAAVLGSVPAG